MECNRIAIRLLKLTTMYISKLDKKVLQMFPELSNIDLNTFSIIRWNDYNYFKKNRHYIKKNEIDIVYTGLNLYESNLLRDNSFDGTNYELDRISTMGLHRMFYLAEINRIKRVNSISVLRRVINAGNVAKRLFRKHPDYITNIDKFLSDYNLVT